MTNTKLSVSCPYGWQFTESFFDMRNGLTDHAEAILAQRQYAVSKGDLAAGADNFSFCLRGNRHRVLAAVNRNDHTVRAVCGDSLVGNVTLAMERER